MKLIVKNVNKIKYIEMDFNKYTFISSSNYEVSETLISILKLCEHLSEGGEYDNKALNLIENSYIELKSDYLRININSHGAKIHKYGIDLVFKFKYDIFNEHEPSNQKRLLNLMISDMKTDKQLGNLIVISNSPYIWSQLNILVAAYDINNVEFTDGANLNYDELSTYHINDNIKVYDTKSRDKHLIDNIRLSNEYMKNID